MPSWYPNHAISYWRSAENADVTEWKNPRRMFSSDDVKDIQWHTSDVVLETGYVLLSVNEGEEQVSNQYCGAKAHNEHDWSPYPVS